MNCCAECANLDKSKKIWDEAHYCYRYGCKSDLRNGVVGWIMDDNGLKTMGGSCFKAKEKQEQTSLFNLI